MTLVDYTALNNWKFAQRVEVKCSHQKNQPKGKNVWGDECVN